MITILERPQGHILDTTAKTATVSESYGAGDAQFVVPTTHGLTDGDWIYSISDIEDYAGFFYVDVITTGIFKLKTSANGDYVQFIAAGSITYYESNLTHGWSAVHLPITYRLSSDLYPVNTSDSSQTISSVTDSNGYSVIHLSGSLGSGVNTYDFIKITVPSDTDYSGVYQILEFISPTVMIINLEYDSSINWTSANALKHYNNYNILVRVYAGLNASHQWAGQKPYVLAATKELIPDADNECFFSINEILKSYITTRNNLGLGTLPNNIDFMTMFYIEVAESYDDSDGYVFGTNVPSYTSDQSNFEGYAVNAKLEFKNLYSGYMSEYLMTNTAAKFLTLFTIPVLFSCGDDTPNCYQDISFINNNDENFTIILTKQYYNDGVLQITDTSELTDSKGIIRLPIESECSYDRLDLKLTQKDNIDDLLNYQLDGVGFDWSVVGGGLEVTAQNGPSEILYWNAYLSDTTPASVVLRVTYDLVINSGAGDDTYRATMYLLDSGLVHVDSENQTLSLGSGLTKDFTLDELTTPVLYFGFLFNCLTGGAGPQDNVTLLVTNVEVVSSSGDIDSETKQFEIDCGCSNQEIRLTWLNNLGGFEYWAFTAQKDHIIEIQAAIETKKNILPQWPKSYGPTADTVRKQTARISNKAYTVRSQFLTADEADAIAYIKSSVLVQIVNSRLDRRTVIVDTDSYVKRKDGDKTFEVAFNISFTDDIPSQTV